MKALLKNYHQAPRKVRLVADLIRGKSVPEARETLQYLPKKSAPALEKLLNSAVANARSTGHADSELFIKTITVNKGMVMRRSRPFARGRAGTLDKVMSIVAIELGENGASTKKAPAKKTAAKKVAKKAAKKEPVTTK
jgi:large subunit ribosomal protein L22